MSEMKEQEKEQVQNQEASKKPNLEEIDAMRAEAIMGSNPADGLDARAAQLMEITDDQIRSDARKYLDHTVSENTQTVTFGVIIQILIDAGLTTRDDLNKRVANCQVELLSAIEKNVTDERAAYEKKEGISEQVKKMQMKYFDMILEEIPVMKELVTSHATKVTGPNALDVDQTKDLSKEETKKAE